MTWSGRWVVVTALLSLTACAGPRSRARTASEDVREESTPGELVRRGEAFAALGDMTRAEQYFVAALKAGGDAGALVRRLVAVCVADGRYPVALEYAEEHLRNHPTDVAVRHAAATVRAALGDVGGARVELRAVLGSRPDIADAHYALAILAKGEGDVMGADASFREYLRLAPNGPRAEVARANLMQTVPR